jgi:enediyne biosynthesis protein E4
MPARVLKVFLRCLPQSCRYVCRITWLAVMAGGCVTGWCLDWKSAPGHRVAAIAPAAPGKAGFASLDAGRVGITFANMLPTPRHLTNQILLNGSGVAAGDVDGDGWCDLFLCGLDRPSALYRNLGAWKFSDFTTAAGLNLAGFAATGAAFADLDGDGDLDLIVNSVGQGTRVFLNDGRGRFSLLTTLNGGFGGTSLALGDLDGDGYLDLYIANYRTSALMDMPNTLFNFTQIDGRKVISRVNGRSVTEPDLINRFRLSAAGGIEENGEPDMVYQSVVGKSFAPLSFTGGKFLDEDGRPLSAAQLDWGLSVMIRDLNQDGLPDIYVCNDFDSPECIWLNQGGGRFQLAPRLAFRKSSLFSMGVDVADINRDGVDDLFVLDMLSRDRVTRMDMAPDRRLTANAATVVESRPEYMMNTLSLGRGDGTYAEIAHLAGVAAADWAWAAVFLDVDLDGYEDILITNGNERQSRSLDVAARLRQLRTTQQLSNQEILENRRLFPRHAVPNIAFRNRGDLTFDDLSAAWGFDFRGVSHGICLADLDNDGDLDVVVNNLNDPPSLLRNESAAPRVAVRLKGATPNTRGIGARITVRGGAVPQQSQEMICGGRYLSSDEPMRVFAAGSATNVLEIEVQWRSGRRSLVTGVKPDTVCEIDEASAVPARRPGPPVVETLFTDVSPLLGHSHRDEAVDDFVRQPLLSAKLSQPGPGLSWIDLDGDGREELLVSGGKGAALGAYLNNGPAGLARINGPFTNALSRDQTTVLPWRNGTNAPLLLVGQASDEMESDGPCVRAWPVEGQPLPDFFPAIGASAGALAMADVDGDGRLDLFVGGRFVPGRYPESGSSAFFRGTADGLVLDTNNSAALHRLGLVTGALFSDLDGGGKAELLVATEWGPLSILRGNAGKLSLWDAPVTLDAEVRAASLPRTTTLSRLTGWWTGIAAGDFNGDGRMDFIAGNLGRNTRYNSYHARPIELVYGDFNGDGGVQMIESSFEVSLNKSAPLRQLDALARAMPFLRERFSSNQTYAQAGIEEVLGDRMKAASRLGAACAETMLFLNEGGRFRALPLPVEAQMSAAFGVSVADFDGDGKEDVFLAQNFFDFQPEMPRLDAGRGLMLLGLGTGRFRAVSGDDSGIKIYGEQRGSSVADFDVDGRMDLAVGQNNGETKLFRNAKAQRGLRVRLIGTDGNPDAIGATLRPIVAGVKGALQELHAGSGWWSCDSPVSIVPAAATEVEVRWPGGMVTNGKVPAGAREISISANGVVLTK